jgi:iron complex outermembrane receptor protein
MQTPGSNRSMPKWIPAVGLSLQLASVFGHAVCDHVGVVLARRPSARANCRRHLSSHLAVGLCVLLLLMLGVPGWAQERATVDLSKASLEDLMNVQVTSVSKKEEKLSHEPAAVFVITQEEIRRSGATNIPDLLRMVPGLDVAQINANTWAISARGFNGQLANKMLVMIDGRTVYDPSFAGVYWDSQDVVLEDIDRIEVIRGPGAAMWGTNAVNGVINIITKSSKDTQGVLLTGGGGNVEQGLGTAQYGGKIGKDATYRIFGNYFNRAGFLNRAGQEAADGWRMNHGGFRADWELSARDSLTLEGDIYGGVKGQPYPVGFNLQPPYSTPAFTSIMDFSGGNILGRWTRKVRPGSEMSLQMYFDRISRADVIEPELRSTFDLDFQHHLTLGGRHDVVWGFGYRNNRDHMSPNPTITLTPATFSSSIENAFFQDEINLVKDRLWLTVGTKVEHNYYTGFEVEPTVRLLWTPGKRHTFWTAFSKANKTPARGEADIRYNLETFPVAEDQVALLSFFGKSGLDSEELKAYEFGYRFEPNESISLDVTSFYNVYDRLRNLEPGTPFFEAAPLPPHLVFPLVYDGKAYGFTYGAEALLGWKVRTFWTLQGGYTWFVPSIKLDPSSLDVFTISELNSGSPRNQFQIRSYLDLPHRFTLDTSLYRVGRLAAGSIPAYTRFDTHLGWRLNKWTELSVVGQNLFDPRHPEFQALVQTVVTTQARRSVYGKVTWRF